MARGRGLQGCIFKAYCHQGGREDPGQEYLQRKKEAGSLLQWGKAGLAVHGAGWRLGDGGVMELCSEWVKVGTVLGEETQPAEGIAGMPVKVFYENDCSSEGWRECWVQFSPYRITPSGSCEWAQRAKALPSLKS